MTGSDQKARRSPERPRPRRVSGGEGASRADRAMSGSAGGIGRSGGPADREADPVGEALRALPAETAGPGFAARVLARLDESGRAPVSPALRPAAVWALLAAAALVAAVGLAVTRSGGPPAAAPVRVAELPAAEAPGHRAPVAGEEEEAAAAPGDASGDAPGDAPGDASSDDPSAPSRGELAPRRERMRPESPPAAGDARLAGSGSASAAPVPRSEARASLARLRDELDALRRDHRRLEIGLVDLPEVGRDGQPVIYVGGDEGLELVLDLGRDSARGPDARGERPTGTSL